MAKAKKDFKTQAQGLGGLNSVLQNTSRSAPPPAREPQEDGKTSVEEKEPAPQARKRSTKPKVVRPNRKTQSEGETYYREVAKPKYLIEEEQERPKSERGCKDGETRKTFIISKDTAEKLQDIAYWEPGKLKDHVNAALEAYVKKKWTKERPKGA